MRRKRHRKNSKKYIILTTVFLLFLFSVGYSAFSSEFLISGKGTILEEGTISVGGNAVELVTSGDGLYESGYEEGRYIYKGGNPNNYILFNDETWRIISIESDKTLKIIGNSIGSMVFDSVGARTTGYCSQGDAPTKGCNAWAKMDYFSNGNYSGSVEADSELNTYLNTTYYNGLSTTAKNLIVSHDFYINDSYTWYGKIALITESEMENSTSAAHSWCRSLDYADDYSDFKDCRREDAWIWDFDEFTITPYGTGNLAYISYIKLSGMYGDVNPYQMYYTSSASTSGYASPVVYIKAGLSLQGKGTSSEPYQIS